MGFWRLSDFTRLGIILLLLSGCQSGPLPPGPAATGTNTDKTATVPSVKPSASPLPSFTATLSVSQTIDLQSLRGVHVAFWYPFLDVTASQVQSLVNEFNRENTWGIQVDTDTLGNESELYRQVIAALPGEDGTSSSGVPLPDVVVADPEQAASWQNAGPGLLNLTDYIGDSSFGWTASEQSAFIAAWWNRGSSNGEQVGIPAEGDVQGLFYNTTWARQLGFDKPPATPDEFRLQACKAAAANRQDAIADNDGTGGWLVDSRSTTTLGWIDAFGGAIINASDNHYTFNTPQVTNAFTYLKKLITDGCAWLGLNPQPYDYFANREALFYSGNLEDIQPEEQALINARSQDDWMLIAMPSTSGLPVFIVSGPSYYIFRSTDVRQLAAWLFVRWMASPQQQVRLIEADGSFPLNSTETNLLSDYRQENPEWTAAVQLTTTLQAGPTLASWRQVSSIVEDASQQLFQPETTSDQISGILAQMDSMAAELVNGAP